MKIVPPTGNRDHRSLKTSSTLTSESHTFAIIESLIMSNQYDSIASVWDQFKSFLPGERMYSDNVKQELGQLPEDFSILEFACGTGFYTGHALDCGASNIIALDISSEMIAKANEKFHNNVGDRVSFHVANCADQAIWETIDALKEREGTFDVVLAGWLLNYAATESELANMFSNIRIALKPNGRFIGTTIPAQRIQQFKPVPGTTKVNESFPGVVMHNIGNVEGGYKMRNQNVGDVTYEYYFLRPELY